MNRIRHTCSRWLGLSLAVLMLALGPVLPLLDEQAGAQGPVLEQEHSEGACVVGHDHRICVLAGTLRSLLSQPRPLPRADLRVYAQAFPDRHAPAVRPATSSVRTRAPPATI